MKRNFDAAFLQRTALSAHRTLFVESLLSFRSGVSGRVLSGCTINFAHRLENVAGFQVVGIHLSSGWTLPAGDTTVVLESNELTSLTVGDDDTVITDPGLVSVPNGSPAFTGFAQDNPFIGYEPLKANVEGSPSGRLGNKYFFGQLQDVGFIDFTLKSYPSGTVLTIPANNSIEVYIRIFSASHPS